MNAPANKPRITKGDLVIWTEEAKEALKIQTLYLGDGPFLVLDAYINVRLDQIDILIDVDRPHGLRYDWFTHKWFKVVPKIQMGQLSLALE